MKSRLKGLVTPKGSSAVDSFKRLVSKLGSVLLQYYKLNWTFFLLFVYIYMSNQIVYDDASSDASPF